MPSATTPHALPGMILREVRKAVIGKDLVLTKVLIAFLAGGHVLMEDMPGVGKTTLAMAFSKALGLSCRRVQFTPDVLPSDLTGFSVYEKSTEKFVFQPGALFCHLLLADEINRTSSKTQAALLEAMEEGNVTVEGKTYALPQPHLVIATQNPLGCVGTQSLPESAGRYSAGLHTGASPGIAAAGSRCVCGRPFVLLCGIHCKGNTGASPGHAGCQPERNAGAGAVCQGNGNAPGQKLSFAGRYHPAVHGCIGASHSHQRQRQCWTHSG